MKDYYKHQVHLPMEQFLSATKEDPLLVSTIIKCNGHSTKELSINLESIPAIRDMLDTIEKRILEELQ